MAQPPTSVSPLQKSGGEQTMSLSKIVLYAMIGAILLVLIVIVVLVICLCKRRKQNLEKKKMKDSKMPLNSLEEEATSKQICCKSKKKKERINKSESSLPDPDDAEDPLPSPPPYEPGTKIGGVYERVSTADIDLKYNVVFTNTPDPKLEQKINTYVSIGRSNSFNPKRRERPVVKRSPRDAQADVLLVEDEGDGCEMKKSTNDSAIKCIETGIAPLETEDIAVRVRDIVGYPERPEHRIKQKRTSSKSSKHNNKSPHNNNSNNNINNNHLNNSSLTHELVKITPPVRKKDLNKLPRNPEHRSKPPSVSGASVVSSNDSEAASNVGTDSGYEDINSEGSPTARRHQRDVEVDGDVNSDSRSTSPAGRRNYIDVDVVPLPCSRLLQQRCDSINERRNSEKPVTNDVCRMGVVDSREGSMVGTHGSVYTQVMIDPQQRPT